jgi:hypothetical protein
MEYMKQTLASIKKYFNKSSPDPILFSPMIEVEGEVHFSADGKSTYIEYAKDDPRRNKFGGIKEANGY